MRHLIIRWYLTFSCGYEFNFLVVMFSLGILVMALLLSLIRQSFVLASAEVGLVAYGK